MPLLLTPTSGTVAGGDAVSPWDGLTIDGDYIKTEARLGRWEHSLRVWSARLPGVVGRSGFGGPFANSELTSTLARSRGNGILRLKGPMAGGGDTSLQRRSLMGNKTKEPLNYGMIALVRHVFASSTVSFTAPSSRSSGDLIPEVRASLPAARPTRFLDSCTDAG